MFLPEIISSMNSAENGGGEAHTSKMELLM